MPLASHIIRHPRNFSHDSRSRRGPTTTTTTTTTTSTITTATATATASKPSPSSTNVTFTASPQCNLLLGLKSATGHYQPLALTHDCDRIFGWAVVMQPYGALGYW
ncbi:hypothetical protein M404DRAFT_1000742 [Pisolithus tinctorius Marx 270]|uniref:Uncharacterized protein n=1 Tax=Pisolithus tinctorius Marx 270 TaxID=870435 RepID=A0A0C3K3V1_PISTI|nr:hypothetical protein M404DRAFT_1000742 [Pisolithus tinctorius Marx 270]